MKEVTPLAAEIGGPTIEHNPDMTTKGLDRTFAWPVAESIGDMLYDWLTPYMSVRLQDATIVRSRDWPWNIKIVEHAPGVHPELRGSSIAVSGASDFDISRAVMSVVRIVFKTLVLAQGGLNLHAGCLSRSGKGVIVLGERGAGKTTSILSALRLAQGSLSFVSNDQVVLSPTLDSGGRNQLIGFPALVKVRRRAASVIDLPWHLALRFVNDTLQGHENEETGIFAPRNLCSCLGADIVPETSLVGVVSYQRAAELDTFEIDYCRSEAREWLADAELPLRQIYSNRLVDIGEHLVAASVSMPMRFSDSAFQEVPFIHVKCGRNQLPRFTMMLQELIGE